MRIPMRDDSAEFPWSRGVRRSRGFGFERFGAIGASRPDAASHTLQAATASAFQGQA